MASNHIFAYIDKGYKLSEDLKKQYRNSLIFLGDEGQIYSPANDTYIGIGHTAYTNTVSYIENAYAYVVEQVGAALDRIISTSVQHNVNQVNGLEKEITIYSTTHEGTAIAHSADTDKQVVYNHINVTEGDRRDDYITNYNALATAATEGYVDSNFVNGLAVTSYTIWLTGSDSTPTEEGIKDAMTKTATGTVEVTGTAGQYYLIDAKDYQTNASKLAANYTFCGSYVYLDDKKTVDFVKQAMAYNVTFTKYWANNQVNAIYSELLGSDYLPVTTEMYDGVDDTHKLTDETLYIKVLATSNTTGESGKKEANTVTTNTAVTYLPVTVSGTDTFTVTKGTWTGLTISSNTIEWATTTGGSYPDGSTDGDGSNVAKRISGTIDVSGATIDGATIKVGETVYALETEAGNNVTNNIKLYYFNTNPTKLNPSINVSDGIQTIQEIAYILDVITDGSQDGGIALTYNIAANAIDIKNLAYIVNGLKSGETAVNSLDVTTKETTNVKEGKYVHLFMDDSKDHKSAYTGNVTLSAALTLVAANEVTDSGKGIEGKTAEHGQYTTTSVDMYSITGHGLIDETVLNTYVAKSYDLIVQNIIAAEQNVGTYIYEVLDGINYSSTYTWDTTTKAFTTTSRLTNVDGGTITADTNATNGTPQGWYIKKVVQNSGYVTAMYDSFKVSSRNYAANALSYVSSNGELTNTGTTTTYQYTSLHVEGDVINVSTYTSPIENVTSYGFLADALSVKSYIMNCFAWINLSSMGTNIGEIDGGYRTFAGANTTSTSYGTYSFAADDKTTPTKQFTPYMTSHSLKAIDAVNAYAPYSMTHKEYATTSTNIIETNGGTGTASPIGTADADSTTTDNKVN